jgi:hypothetical protein
MQSHIDGISGECVSVFGRKPMGAYWKKSWRPGESGPYYDGISDERDLRIDHKPMDRNDKKSLRPDANRRAFRQTQLRASTITCR